jgi:hypothetical protein
MESYILTVINNGQDNWRQYRTVFLSYANLRGFAGILNGLLTPAVPVAASASEAEVTAYNAALSYYNEKNSLAHYAILSSQSQEVAYITDEFAEGFDGAAAWQALLKVYCVLRAICLTLSTPKSPDPR